LGEGVGEGDVQQPRQLARPVEATVGSWRGEWWRGCESGRGGLRGRGEADEANDDMHEGACVRRVACRGGHVDGEVRSRL
jgi:hypothetical protein